MTVITGFDRQGAPVYDNSRHDRAVLDTERFGAISFENAEKELLEFAWEIIPHAFETLQLNNDQEIAYVGVRAWQFLESQTIQRKFTATSDRDRAGGFIGSGISIVRNPWFPYMTYSGNVGAAGDTPGTGVWYGPFSGEAEWIVDDSNLVVDPETAEWSVMTYKLRAVSPIQYGSDLEKYTFPSLPDIATMDYRSGG